jgi:hypothetical protein
MLMSAAAALAALAAALPSHAAADAASTARAQAQAQAGQAARPQLRPQIASLVVAAQDKIRGDDASGAVADLDHVMMLQPTAFELGIALTVRGGALYTQGDLDGARADWSRALIEGALDTNTQLNLVQNLERLDSALR